MLYKRGRVYYLDVTANGRRIRQSLKKTVRFEALNEARKLIDKWRQEQRGDDITFNDFCKKYTDWAWTEKPISARHEEFKLNKIKPFFKSLKLEYLSDINPYHIEQFKSKLVGDKLAKATVNKYLSLLGIMFNRAIDWQLYSQQNPLKKVKFYKLRTRTRILSHAQVDKVLDVATELSERALSPLQKAYRDLLVLVLHTGLRKAEVLNLRWSQIKGAELEIKGKGGKTRIIPLNKMALSVINKQLKRNAFVFDIPNRHIPTLFKRSQYQIEERTGIKFHLHLLRHRFASTLLEKGVDIVTVSELLGHSKLATSLMYTHTDEERKRKAVKKLE